LTLILPKIYPITDAGIAKLTHADQVRRLIAGGAEMIQLRGKSASAREFYADVVEALKVARNHEGTKLIINDRVDIALAVGANGVHLGQDDLPPEHARAILGGNAIIGFSTHSVEQAREALSLPIDYIAAGPIFPTSSKPDPEPVIGLDGLRSVREIVGRFPLVAIGGINRKNAVSVFDAGADAVALISDIISEPAEITDRMRELTQLR
jgi:thiamine-phosphate pyrophosphorylase